MTASKAINVRGGVLVGHDGSRHARGALRTAVRFAAALKIHVTVARVWSISTAPRPASWAPGYMPPLGDFEAETLAALDRDIAPVCADNPDVMITSTVAHGRPAEVLIEASSRVDLIVVGSRGHGGFAGLLLGSVSEQSYATVDARCLSTGSPMRRPRRPPLRIASGWSRHSQVN